jgi:glucose-6-phosphate 1-dehydrogenase
MNSEPETLNTYVDTVVKGKAPDLKIPDGACMVAKPVEPCCIVIFGATGDLTARKLIPALYNLYLLGAVPDSSVIIGAARTDMSDDEFRQKMRQALSGMDTSKLDEFMLHVHYHSTAGDSPESFKSLSDRLKDMAGKSGARVNKIFYLATPPSASAIIAKMLGETGLSREREDGNGWSHIVVEKPFGSDLKSAIDLNRSLRSYFREDQIFRIDHYLAKETVQNVLMFRFANAIFEPLWNRMYVDHVHIDAAESIGVENRAHYYEEAGVLRDMFQNHMMQLLAVTAMEPPSLFKADQVRDEQVKVFRSLRPFSAENPSERLILGQYGPGIIDGKPVPGYRQEAGVDPRSLTPTFGMMTVFVDNWRWQDVPFYLTSGKRLAKKLTEIVIHFKSVPHLLFQPVLEDTITANVLTLRIYPDEKINLTFQTKNPGAAVCLRSVTMDFNYKHNYSGPILDAYEKALLDCMEGDQTLFWRQDAVELCWSFLEPVLERCEHCAERAENLFNYDAGSWGPEKAAISRHHPSQGVGR